MLVARKNPNRYSAACNPGTSIADIVGIAGAPVSGRYFVDTTDPSTLLEMPGIGVCIDKVGSTTAVIQFQGEVKGIFTGLTPGKVYWVSSGGGITSTPPIPTVLKPRIYLQAIGVALASDVLMLQPDPKMSVRVL